MKIPVDIQIDFLWGEQHFQKEEWGPITYIVGANGTGKSIFAEKIKARFIQSGLKVRYFGADRIANLAGKWDAVGGQLAYDKLSKGLDIDSFDTYKAKAEQLGQSFDVLIELKDKLDLQIKVESILSDVFQKELTFKEKAGFLNVLVSNKKDESPYDLKKNESHGLKELITLLTFIYSDDYNCIILDEPELNLHPQYQQFILQELKKIAGNPEKGKKIFIVLTHSPYMLDIKTSTDLLNYIVFHKDSLPSFIVDYEMDEYQLNRLNKLLMRINTNHKTMFFASSPVFVEGYIDQQLLNLIESKRDVPLGAEGISIIDVGGKDEVDIMFTLCNKLGIKAKAIVDLDALFEGKLRQTIADLPASTVYLAKHGQKDLMATIGVLQTLTSEISELLTNIDPSTLSDLSTEFTTFLSTLKNVVGDKATQIKRRLTLLAIQRIYDEISEQFDAPSNIKLTRAKSLLAQILTCLENSNVFVLAKGEIENYYVTYTENQYSIADNKKTDYFLTEFDAINELSKSQLTEQYPELISILDKICPVTTIDTKRMIGIKLSDWIHSVQSLFQSNNSITKASVEASPKTQWDKYKRLIELVDFSADKKSNTFVCKFKINSKLLDCGDSTYEFTQNTVPSQFKI